MLMNSVGVATPSTSSTEKRKIRATARAEAYDRLNEALESCQVTSLHS